MVDIIIYIFVGLCFGFLIGLFFAAVLLDRRTKKRQRDLARLIGARGNGKTGGHMFPYCYLEQEEDEEGKE